MNTSENLLIDGKKYTKQKYTNRSKKRKQSREKNPHGETEMTSSAA